MKKVNKKLVNEELKKLVNMSRLLTEEKIEDRIMEIIKNYLSDESGILFTIDNGLLVIEGIDY